MKRLHHTLSLLAIMLALTGCQAGITGNRISYESPRYSATPAKRTAVYVDLTSTTMFGTEPYPNTLKIQRHQAIVRSALEKTGIFGPVTFNGIEQRPDDLKLQVSIEETQVVNASSLLVFFSLGLIPSSTRYNYQVTLKAKTAEGDLMEIDRNNDYLTHMLGWFVGPWATTTPDEAEQDTLERQLSAAVNRLLATNYPNTTNH